MRGVDSQLLAASQFTSFNQAPFTALPRSSRRLRAQFNNSPKRFRFSTRLIDGPKRSSDPKALGAIDERR